MSATGGALIGLMFAAGLLLAVMPWVVPARERVSRRQSRLAVLVRASGVPRLTAGGVVSACALSGLVAAAVALVVTSLLVVAVLAGAAGAVVPLMLLRRKAAQRERALASSWADAVDMLVSGVRAGLSLGQALGDLAVRGPEVLRPAFAQFEADLRVTGSLGVAMDALQRRLGDPVADRVLTALRIAQEVGGTDLGAVLRSLAAMLRQDHALRGEIEARQSWTVNAARLSVAAPWLTLAFLCTRPEAVAAYATATGGLILLASATLSAGAYALMRRIARLPREPRLQS